MIGRMVNGIYNLHLLLIMFRDEWLCAVCTQDEVTAL